MSGLQQHPEIHDEYEWAGDCRGCGRERTLKTRISHASKALCDECAAKPHKPPSAAGIDTQKVAPEKPRDSDEWHSWMPRPLEGFLTGETVEEAPMWLERSDGRRLLYMEKLHSISGEPESGKGWLVLAAIAQMFEEYANGHVIYIDFEDTPQAVVGRLLALGADPKVIRERFNYVKPDEPVDDARQLEDLYLGVGDDTFIVVLDGITEGMALHGLDPLSNVDIARWRHLMVDPFRHSMAAIVEIDHVVKDKESRGRFALGGIHKLAGVDVAYGVKVLSPFGRGRSGKLKLTVHKDRAGSVRGFATHGVAAIVDIESYGEGQVRVTLEPPSDDQAAPTAAFRPTVLMERVSRQIEDTPALSWSAIRGTVKGNNRAIDLALELLVAEGYVRVEIDGQARRHHHLKPYREATDGTLLNPAHDPAQSRVVENPAPLPTSIKAGAGFDGHAPAPETLTPNEIDFLAAVVGAFPGAEWEIAA